MLIGLAALSSTLLQACFAKLMNLSKEKINPMIGAAGISAFPMAARMNRKWRLEDQAMF